MELNASAKLNNEQRQAVRHRQGPLLVVAGAGTGKTTVLVNRLADILLGDKLDSDRVLLLTFYGKSGAGNGRTRRSPPAVWIS